MSYILARGAYVLLTDGTFGEDPRYAALVRYFDEADEAWAVVDQWPVEHRDGFVVWEVLTDEQRDGLFASEVSAL